MSFVLVSYYEKIKTNQYKQLGKHLAYGKGSINIVSEARRLISIVFSFTLVLSMMFCGD